MADDDPTQVNSFGLEDGLLIKPAFARRKRMRGYGCARFDVGLGARAKNSLNVGGDARTVGRALDYRGLDAGAGYTFDDVSNKEVDHGVAAVGPASGDTTLPVVGHFIE